MIALEEHKTLQPGQTVAVATCEMRIVGPGSPEGSGLIPRYSLAPGRYRVEIGGNERDSSVPVSGSLEFEVVK